MNGASAVLSQDGVYRYLLTRTWAEGPALAFVMLNPSTADATADDPTIRRCIGFAKREGFGGLTVVNLYALRATDPRELRRAIDPVGPDNDGHLRRVTWESQLDDAPAVVAWGAHAAPDRVAAFVRLATGTRLVCLGTTQAGAPRHPLYIAGAQPLVPWTP